VAICWSLLAAWLHRCVIGSYDLGKLGWADQLLGCAGWSILTFPFFSFLYFLQPNSSIFYQQLLVHLLSTTPPMYQFIYCKLLHTRGIWRHLASRFKRLKGRKGVEHHTLPCRLKNYGECMSMSLELCQLCYAPQVTSYYITGLSPT
jgi:hypothetical protein